MSSTVNIAAIHIHTSGCRVCINATTTMEISLPVRRPSLPSVSHRPQQWRSMPSTVSHQSIQPHQTAFAAMSVANTITNPNRDPSFPDRRSSSSIIIGNTFARRNSVIVCARKNTRRRSSKRRLSVSSKTSRFLIQSMHLLVSNFNVLPAPLNDVVFSCFGGGNAGGGSGGSGFLRRFGGGGGFGWGRRRRSNGKLGLFGFFVMVGVLILLVLDVQVKSDLIWGILGVAQLGVSISYFCRRGFRNWVLGICFSTGLLCLGLSRDEAKKWIERIKVRSPLMDTISRRRKRCKGAL